MRITAIVAAIVTITAAPWLVAQTPQPAPVQPLSAKAMDALIAGIAFYPDAVIEQILDAAQYPDAIKSAAAGQAPAAQQQAWPTSVRLLTSHPEILKQLDDNAVVTARLALAARTQLADVWAAIDRVRKQFESQAQDTTTELATGGTPTSAALIYPSGAFLAGFWTAQVVDEIGVWYAATAPVAAAYGQGSVTVVGPGGNGATLNAAGGAAAVKVGDTTYFGAAGGATVATADGTVIHGQGQMTGSATQSENGGSYQKESSGSVQSNTGQSAKGARSTSGSYKVNPDGSVDFQRSANTGVASDSGATKVDHSGSGTYTGQGTGSYEGSTDIDSTRGDASIDTTASGGQITSTIDTAKGQKTITLGDGKTGTANGDAAQRTSGLTTSTRMARPTSMAATTSRYSQPTIAQWQSASRSLAQSWNVLSKGTTGFSGTNSLWATRLNTGAAGTSPFARTGGNGGASGTLDALRANAGATPNRTTKGTPNRAPASGRRGKR